MKKRICVLDTDICIYWLNGSEKIRKTVENTGTDVLRTTIVTVAELRYGAHNSQRAVQNLENIDNLLRKIKILPLDQRAADLFGKIKAQLRSQGQIINDFDILIASITLRHKGILITNNTEHFKRIKDLICANWMEEESRQMFEKAE